MPRALTAALLIALAGCSRSPKGSFEQRYEAALGESRRGEIDAALRSVAALRKQAEKAKKGKAGKPRTTAAAR